MEDFLGIKFGDNKGTSKIIISRGIINKYYIELIL